MHVLLTGAAGFIGMHTAQRLLARGDAVTGIDNLNSYYDPALKQARLAQLQDLPGFRFERLDVADRAGMEALFARERFDTVVHLAAQAGCFDVVRDKFLATPAVKLQPDDLLKKDAAGRSVLFLLAQTQQLDIAFDPRLWAGRKNEMLAAYAGVPSAFRGTLDLPALATAIDQLTLQSRAPKPALRLKPPGR